MRNTFDWINHIRFLPLLNFNIPLRQALEIFLTFIMKTQALKSNNTMSPNTQQELFPLGHMIIRELQLPEPVIPFQVESDNKIPKDSGGKGGEPQWWDLSPSYTHNLLLFGTETSGLQIPGHPKI